MTRHRWTVGAVAAAFTLSLAPAWADQGGSRPNTTGSSSGSAVPRGGAGGSSGSGGGSSSGAGSAGSSGSSSSMGSGGGSSMSGSRSAPRERAPQRPAAMPRGAGSAGNTDARAIGRPGSAATAGPDERGRSRSEVPTYSRPRDGRNVTGTAVDRSSVPGRGGSIYYPGIYYPYDPYYSYYYGSYYSRYGYYPYSQYWIPGYGFGFGYLAYDPLMYGGYDYTYPSYGSGGYSAQYRDVGNLRLKVKPASAQVYVDGYYVGVVDSFDGVFQRLGIESGAHRIELRAEGYETVQFEVFVTPGETVTYKGEMKIKGQ